MEKDLAKIIALTAFRSSSDINNLIPLLKAHCSEDEYQRWIAAIAAVSAEISQQILQKTFVAYPDLADEFERQVQKFGRPF